MASEAEIRADLEEIFRDVFMSDELCLEPGLSAADVEGWDSFKQVEIIMASEEKWGIRFTTRELDTLADVGDLIRVILSKVP